MKKRIFSLLVSFAALGLMSCNDWLELTPPDRVSDKAAWESQAATDLYVNNFYEYIAIYGQFGDQQFQGNLTEGLTELHCQDFTENATLGYSDRMGFG